MKKHLLEVKSNSEIAKNIFKLELFGDFDLQEFAPGKFIHIRCSDSQDPFLRRPMSICDLYKDRMIVLYRRQGVGTQVLAKLNPGIVLDVLAPLGNPFPYDQLKPNSQVLLVGGGIGVPPLYYLGRKLKERGHRIVSLLGFNSAEDVFYQSEFAALGESQISTIDGSFGYQGYVTDLISNYFYDVLYSCGPMPMLKTVQRLTSGQEAYLSLEQRMACGVGACLACVCKPTDPANKSYNRVCTEGPVFLAQEILL